MAVRRKHIRNLVEQILNNQKVINAPIKVEDVAHLYGIKIQYEPAENNLSGFLLRNLKEHKAIVGVNQAHPPNRQRFTIAHELGHFFLHETERMYVDRILQVKLRNENSSKGISTEEKEANLFAAESRYERYFTLQPNESASEVEEEIVLLNKPNPCMYSRDVVLRVRGSSPTSEGSFATDLKYTWVTPPGESRSVQTNSIVGRSRNREKPALMSFGANNDEN